MLVTSCFLITLITEMQKVASVASGACAIFFPSCANFWAVYAQKC